MVRTKYILILLFLVIGNCIRAQGHLFSEIRTNKSSIYVGEPAEIELTVYTSTWYTKGIDLGNITVNGAFTIFYDSQPTSKTIKGKTYSGVKFRYNVFPYDDEDLVFPSLEIIVETPDEGGYAGVKRKVISKEKKIRVKSIPKGYEKEEWLVAYGLKVSEKWEGNSEEVKVGDVLERRVTRKVTGTVSELIPPIQWDTLINVSLYPTRSSVNTTKSSGSVSSERSEGVRYLFEKEGHVEIPEMEITWWNPAKNKLYKRSIPGKTIEVLSNPDLGMLESVRDSLSTENSIEEQEASRQLPDHVGPFSLTEFVLICIVGLFILYQLIKRIIRFSKEVQKRREEYLATEKHFFEVFKRHVRLKHKSKALNALYYWLDQLHLEESSAHYFAGEYGSEALKKAIDDWNKRENKDQLTSIPIKEWEDARRAYLHPELFVKSDWINP